MDLYSTNEFLKIKVLEKDTLIRALDSYIELSDIYKEELEKKDEIINELLEIIERIVKEWEKIRKTIWESMINPSYHYQNSGLKVNS